MSNGKEPLAHIAENGRYHDLRHHLEKVARLARRFASSFGSGEWAFLAGKWHDVGKFSRDFQERLRKARDPDAHIENAAKRPDHSTAGAQHALTALGGAGKLIAYAIAGHHAGLPDGKSNEASCLERRLEKNIPDYSACPRAILQTTLPSGLPLEELKGRRGFQRAFFIRMLYSALVDADFLDTESFMDPEASKWRQGYPPLSRLKGSLNNHLNRLADESTEVNRRRARVLAACRAAAEWSPGLFSLTVPTGGGKTLSSLAFALDHALGHDLRRIVYVIPYTSIIEQTAGVFRDVLGADAVLEHHSNFEPEKEDRRSRLASENWDAPLVVTTNVQFFESLFHNRSSRCRKLHNIARSVVILDEAQLLPVHLLRPCMEALRELALNYGSSAVLCTATQPALHRREDFPFGLENVREIVPDPEELYLALRRVRVENLGAISDEELSGRISEEERALCVVNTRGHARRLYETLEGDDARFHLSALMCPAHRSEKLAEIRGRLQARPQRPCRVVSTQLVEAGVDVDFPAVFRAVTGIDSVAQAAGRCNREGELPEPGRVFLFAPEHESPAYLRQNIETAQAVLRRHPDPLSLEAVKFYFETLYWRKGEELLDRERILERLEEDFRRLNFPFRDIARCFRVIEESTIPVIVPRDEKARELVASLRYAEHAGRLGRALQSYAVTIYPGEMQALERAGSVEAMGPGKMFRVLTNPEIYRDDVGLCLEDPSFHAPENLVLDRRLFP